MTELKSTFTRDLPRKKKHKEIRVAVCKAIDEMEIGQKFSSLDLYEQVMVNCPELKMLFLETVLRYARMYRRDKFQCVDRSNSLYIRIQEEVQDE